MPTPSTIPADELQELAVLGSLFILARHTANTIEREAWQFAWDDACLGRNDHLLGSAIELAKEIL